MPLLRFRQTRQISQNLRLALRLAEERQFDEVAARLREALAEAEAAEERQKRRVLIETRGQKHAGSGD